MSWCEASIYRLRVRAGQDDRLKAQIETEMSEAQAECIKPAKPGGSATYRTLDSWSCSRRVVGKAGNCKVRRNPRFIVTTLDAQRWPARELYELYCARGEMENRIRSASCTCSPIAPRRRRCGPISCGWFASFAW